jgi:hypothetical protein
MSEYLCILYSSTSLFKSLLLFSMQGVYFHFLCPLRTRSSGRIDLWMIGSLLIPNRRRIRMAARKRKLVLKGLQIRRLAFIVCTMRVAWLRVLTMLHRKDRPRKSSRTIPNQSKAHISARTGITCLLVSISFSFDCLVRGVCSIYAVYTPLRRIKSDSCH